jgi:hypothetical protein
MIRSGIEWAKLARRFGLPVGKHILADAFNAQLPGAVTSRRGKVPWDGVCARGYALHGDSIVKEIERASGPLEAVGLDVGWLIKRVARLADGHIRTSNKGNRGDKEVIAAYALATWLRGWGIERVSDCLWS